MAFHNRGQPKCHDTFTNPVFVSILTSVATAPKLYDGLNPAPAPLKSASQLGGIVKSFAVQCPTFAVAISIASTQVISTFLSEE